MRPRRSVHSTIARRWAPAVAVTTVLLFGTGVAWAATAAPLRTSDPRSATPASVLPSTCPGPLVFSFTATPSRGTAPLNVSFTSNLSGGCAPYSLEWQFGDGAAGGARNPVHLYRSAGTFTVNVEVSDGGGHSAEDQTTIVVEGGSGGLVVHVNATVLTGAAPLADTFWANVTGGNTTHAVQTAWKFGDGGNGTGSPIQYTFLRAGNFTVTATVTDGPSIKASASVRVHVGAATGPPPANLSLLAEPAVVTQSDNVTVLAFSSGAVSSLNLSVCFGDGSPCAFGPAGWTGAEAAEFEHAFLAAGNYTITGTLTNQSGGILAGATTGVRVTSGSAMVVGASASPLNGAAPLPVTFQAEVSGGTPPYAVQWTFGDGTAGGSLPGAPTTHQYSTSGAYVAHVRVRDSTGTWKNSSLPTILVLPPKTVATGWSAPILGVPTWGLLSGLAVATVAAGVVLGRRWEWGMVQRRFRREGEDLVRELEGNS